MSITARPSLWVISLMFWLTLIIAAALYAVVALAPKLADFANVRTRFATNAHRLVELESEVEYLERVTSALKSDPRFARQLALASQGGRGQTEEVVPVTHELIFSGIPRPERSEAEPQKSWWMTVVAYLASHPDYRGNLLLCSAVLTLFAFTFLNDSENGAFLRIAGRVFWFSGRLSAVGQRTLARYWKPSTPVASENTHAAPNDEKM
ncbi:MAG: hypothetical protein JNL58_25800 [Planctomyces sp.]|nr:hypothetical protein [Planctomyces sp.]